MTVKVREPWPADTMRLRVADLEIDLERRTLRSDDGEAVELPQRVFELLRVFLAAPGRLQTREALFARVWPGVVVEDANLSQSVWLLRRALGPARRDWVRTMARSGYLFEPPSAVEALPSAASPVRIAPVSPGPSYPAAPPARVRDRASRLPWFGLRRPPRFAPRLLAPLCCVLLLCLGADRPRSVAAEDAPRPVARIAIAPMPPARDAMPADLLQAWLRWTLELAPDAIVLPVDAPGLDSVVRIEGTVAGRDDVVLRMQVLHPARAGRPASAWSIERRAARAALPEAVDALMRQAVARALPARAHDPWPALALDVEAAAAFARASRALREDDWREAVRAADALVQRAPAFGPGHQLRARVLARRGLLAEAGREMDAARRLSWPMSADARRVLEAMALAVGRDRREEAVAAHDALARRWPDRSEFALASATSLLRAGRPREALSRVDALRAARRPLTDADALRARMVHAEALAALGDLDAAGAELRALLSAGARPAAGVRERASVRLLLANVHHALPGRAPSPELYEQAAVAFDAAGDALGAAYARALADLVRPSLASLPTASMRAAVALADAQGNVGVGIEVLRGAAQRAYRSGDYAVYRSLLGQAQGHAIRAGDTAYQHAFDVGLLVEDLFVGNIASARQRVDRLRRAGLDGDALLQVPQLESTLLYFDGQPRAALARLRDAEAGARRIGPMPAFAGAQFACSRVDMLISLGDLREARAALGGCRGPDIPTLRIVADLMEAQMDLLEGDPAQARARLALARRALAARPDNLERWTLVVDAAVLQARLGDPDGAVPLLQSALGGVRREGYGLLEAQMEAAFAEIVASRGDWPAARMHAQRARSLPASRLWAVAHRLDAFDIADAIAHGDAASARLRIDALAQRAGEVDDRVTLSTLAKLQRRPGEPHFDAAAAGNDRRPEGGRAAAVARASPAGAADDMPGARLDWLYAPQRIAGAR